MENKKASKIIFAVILTLSFIIESRLLDSLISVFTYSELTAYILPAISLFASFIICTVITVRYYITLSNILKIAVGAVLIYIIEEISGIIWSSPDLIYQFLRPAIISGILLLLFWWITKIRFRLTKAYLIWSGALLLVSAIFSVSNYLENQFYINKIENYLSSYLYYIFSGSSINSIEVSFCLHAIILLTFWLIVDALPDNPPKKERTKKFEEETEYEIPEIPEGSWRCLGCGEILPDSTKICACGYKRGN